MAGIGVAGAIAGTGGLAAVPLVIVYCGLTLGGAVGGGGVARLGYNALHRYGSRLFERSVGKVLARVERELVRGTQTAIGAGPRRDPAEDSQ